MDEKSIVGRALGFFQMRIWQVDWDTLPLWKAVIYKQMRIIVTVVHEFQKDDVYLRASALTFYSMLSVVPVFAMGFGLAKGFGYEKDLRQQILDSAVGQEEIINRLLDFATTLIEKTQGGVIAGVGLVLLLYTVLKLLNNIEDSFNDIWGVKKHRSLLRKLSDYLSIMLITPILFISAGSLMIYIATYFRALANQGSFEYIGPVLLMLIKVAPYLLVWVMFMLIYMIMPNTKVRMKSGLIAGVIAGTCFVFVQYFYIEFQVGVVQANAIYGSFAALPLFLIWVNISWLITLIGAEIAYAHQNAERYQLQGWAGEPSTMIRRKAALLVTHLVVCRFVAGERGLTMPQLANQLRLPLSFTEKLIADLQTMNILSQVTSGEHSTYQPAQAPERLTIGYVAQQLDKIGDESLQLRDSAALKVITETLDAFAESIMQTDMNRALKDVRN